ncbi:MAG: hypothetical protein JWM11_566 [Planctomycetaceae bacterium]|nr:hypothetical protein [Planctomycetaceae bacterium]
MCVVESIVIVSVRNELMKDEVIPYKVPYSEAIRPLCFLEKIIWVVYREPRCRSDCDRGIDH